MDVVRMYDTGGEILGEDYLSLEIHVTQIVYVASEEILTLEQVTDLVENGYNRGRGGRLRFRALLQENDAFTNVLDVEVLNEVGPPMLPPTPAPTAFDTPSPTKEQTPQPTPAPTIFPSQIPSSSPSVVPSEVPSDVPTAVPSNAPSLVPSASPSTSPTELQQAETIPPVGSSAPSPAHSIVGAAAGVPNDKTPPYVIAAIVLGAWAVLMACCFSCFLCRQNRRRAKQDQQDLLPSGGRDSNDDESPPPLPDSSNQPLNSKQSPSQSHHLSALPVVPNIVQLDDDHRSLAETTLGEHTAGRKPPKKKRLVEMGVTATSFEEESLFTTPIGIIPRIQPGRRIDDDDDEKNKQRRRIVSTPTLGGSSGFSDDIFFPLSDSGSSNQGDDSWMLPLSPIATKIEGLVAAELGPVAPGDHEVLPREQGSTNVESRDDVGGKIGALVGPPKISPRSSSSSLTQKTENVAPGLTLSATYDAPESYQRSVSSSVLSQKKFADDETLSSRDSARSSMQVKDMLHSPMELLLEEERKTSVSPINLAEGDSSVEPRSSPSSDRLPAWITKSRHPWQTVQTPSPRPSAENQGSASPQGFVSPYRTRYLQQLHISAAQREVELEEKLVSAGTWTPAPLAMNTRPEPQLAIVSAASQSKSTTGRFKSPPAKVSQSTAESPPPVSLAAAGDISFMTESSGASSNGENPWLSDTVTQFLGPRSTSVDVESLSGKSTKSGKSWRSHRSSKSLSKSRARKRRKGSSSSVESRGNRSSFSFASPADLSLVPRSLEQDLKRLERQLASLKSSEPIKQSKVPSSPPSLTTNSASVESASKSSSTKISSKQRVVVVAPPGKLGVILANRHNGTGTVVSEIRGSSALRGALLPGDKLRKCLQRVRICFALFKKNLTQL